MLTPQGQAPGVAYHVIVLILIHVAHVPLTNFRLNLDLFAYSAVFLNGAAMSIILFRGMLSRVLTPRDKFLLALIPLAPVYCSPSGFYISIAPDYYGVEITLSTLAYLMFVSRMRNASSAGSLWGVLSLGLLTGFMLGTKVTLVVSGSFVLWPILVKSGQGWKRVAAGSLCAGLVCAVTVWIILWLYYGMHGKSVWLFCREWFDTYLASPVGGEDKFWISVFHPMSSQANAGAYYAYSWFFVTAWLIALVGLGVLVQRFRFNRRLNFAFMGLILFTFGFHILGLIKRPAGGTLIEMAIFLVMSTSMLLSQLPPGRASIILTSIVAVLLLGYDSFQTARFFPDGSALSGRTREVWEIHDWLRDQGTRVVVLIPDARHCGGTVEEAVLLGVDWDIQRRRLRDLLGRVLPNFQYCRSMPAWTPPATILWLDAPGDAPIEEREPTLGSAMTSKKTIRRDWRLYLPVHAVRVYEE